MAKATGQFGIYRKYTPGSVKAYDCLPHDLLIAKLGTYGLDRSSLKIINGLSQFP